MENYKKTMSDMAYERIRDMILNLEIRPGEKIPEEKITEIVKFSRTPVREAIRKLSEDGLVSIYPNRCSEVKYYEVNDIKKIGELRLAQDILSCQLAIQNGSNSDFSQLKDIADKCRNSAEKGEVFESIYWDSQFHLKIAEIGKNDLLIENQEKLYTKIHIIQISKYTNIEDSIKQVSKHYEIVDALYDRDYKRIKLLMCQHLEDFFNIDEEIINMYIN